MEAVLLKVIADGIRSVSKRTQTMAITESSRLVDELGLDSLDLVGVMMKMEDHFGVTIELDEVGNIHTVADLGSHIIAVRKGRSSAA